MTLTIITPTLNAEAFIVGCLQNVAAQGVREVEHLFVDGGSEDNTRAFALTFAETAEHSIRLIDAPGASQSAALNRGIAEARSDIIGILNADDYYESRIFEGVLSRFARLRKTSFLCGNCNIRDLNEEITSVNKPRQMNFSDLLAGRPYPWNPSAYFYHKSLHETVGLYDEDDPLTMDIDFILRAVQAADVRYFDETWGNFRYIPGTKTHQQGQAIQERVDAIRRRYYSTASALDKCAAKAKIVHDKIRTRL